MKNKEHIVQLILQDLKHYQLIKGIERLGFVDELKNDLDLYEMVFEHLDIKEDTLVDFCAIVYDDYLQQATRQPLTHDKAPLVPLAEKCYEKLMYCQELDNRRREASGITFISK